MNSTDSSGSGILHDASLLKICGTGILMGTFHVLTGPDHLSALATLSVGSSWRSFALGVRWGCGHSLGLLIMSLIFLGLDRQIDLTKLNVYTDTIVGVFMIVLGCYGIKSAYHQRKEHVAEPISSQIPLQVLENSENQELVRSVSNEDVSETDEESAIVAVKTYANDYQNPSSEGDSPSDNDSSELLQKNKPLPKWKCHCMNNINMRSSKTQKFAALCVGIVHGIAGPGGILGVMPAVSLHDSIKGYLYLGSFCGASILIMGFFAAFYGETTGRLSAKSTNVEFWLTMISSILSVLVGILWLVLLSVGKLQEFFG